MEKINYWNIFARMNDNARSFTLSQALNIHESEALELLEKIENELKRQETLLALVHQKADLDDEKVQEIEKLKKIRASQKAEKRKKHEGKIERLVRLRYYYEIKKLREEKFTWRSISEYIQQNHKNQIHFTTLQKTFEKISQQLQSNNK
jgi:hypothetical protein